MVWGCEGAVLDVVVGGFLHRWPATGCVDVAFNQGANLRDKQEGEAGHEGEVEGDADKDITDAQKLAGEEARAVEFGHERAAAVDDADVC